MKKEGENSIEGVEILEKLKSGRLATELTSSIWMRKIWLGLKDAMSL